MSERVGKVRTIVHEITYKCDRYGCNQVDMVAPPYTLSGGYGSTILDCEPDVHFCSLQCLREWVNTGWAKDVTK
jgi:hypothetical protein